MRRKVWKWHDEENVEKKMEYNKTVLEVEEEYKEQ